MERLTLLLITLGWTFSPLLQATDGKDVVVFEGKKNMTMSAVRIPALIRTKQGTLLAIAEGRNSGRDQSSNTIVGSASQDEGETWSKPETIYAQGDDSCNNPCVVQDGSTGTIFLFFQTFPAGKTEFAGLPAGPQDPHGNRTLYTTSLDNGKTWSKPTDISTALKPEEAVTTASGPGIGIQIKQGKYAGRLIIPFNSQDAKHNFTNWVAYSDDHGATWKRGKKVPQKDLQLNEVQVAEIANGELYLNSRRWKGTNFRKTSYSKDGGETWSQAVDDEHLPEPTCQASLLRWDPKTLLFLNPVGKGRANGTLRASLDDGKTWSAERLAFPGPFAYSCMAPLKDGRVGVLYEPNGASVLRFRAVDLPTAK
jgi:sialidase-1